MRRKNNQPDAAAQIPIQPAAHKSAKNKPSIKRHIGGSPMSVLVNAETRVLVQGITGKEGSFQTQRCIEYGTKVVAGVTPGRGGETAEGVPVFNRVSHAAKQTGADCALIFVPPPFAADAILEAADASMPLVVCITEGIPPKDMVIVMRALQGSATRP